MLILGEIIERANGFSLGLFLPRSIRGGTCAARTERWLVTILTGPTTKRERIDAVLAAGAVRSADGTLHLPDTLPVVRQARPPLMRWNRRFGSILQSFRG
jgi:hypothetical protein